MSSRSGILLALAAACLFGVSGVVAADAFLTVPPTQVAALRSLFTAFLLAVLAYRRGSTVHGGRLPQLALLGVTIASVTVTYYWAIDRLGVGPGVTIEFLGPVLVMVWHRLVEKRAVPGFAWGAAVAAVIGVAVVAEAFRPARLDPIGVSAGLGAAVSFAAYLILGARLGRGLPALTVASYGFAFSALFWVLATPLPSLAELRGVGWHLLWIVVGGTAAPFLLEVEALRRAPAAVVGVAATAEPVVAALVAWVALGQILHPWQVGGAALVVVAVATIERLTSGWSAVPQ